MISSKGRCIK